MPQQVAAQIERRYEHSGFVYTERTRMLFAPRGTATRKPEDQESTDLVISASSGKWMEPTVKDIGAVRAAIVKEYPDRKLFCDTDEGLVPIYEPPTPPAA